MTGRNELGPYFLRAALKDQVKTQTLYDILSSQPLVGVKAGRG